MTIQRILIAVTVLTAGTWFSGNSIAAQGQDDGPPPEMGFFVTSVGLGDGGNLGGLAGADAHCQSMADTAGSGNRTWQAYLSTQGPGAVNARDRIGSGPWANAEGLIIGTSVENLHYDNSNINWEHALDENGNQFASRIDGDPDFTEHDALTGSQIDGTAFPPGEDRTCSNWTSNSEGSAFVGHADRYSFSTPGSPWNSSHGTPGCTQENLISTGGAACCSVSLPTDGLNPLRAGLRTMDRWCFDRVPNSDNRLGARVETPRRTETGEAPVWQGARREHIPNM